MGFYGGTGQFASWHIDTRPHTATNYCTIPATPTLAERAVEEEKAKRLAMLQETKRTVMGPKRARWR